MGKLLLALVLGVALGVGFGIWMSAPASSAAPLVPEPTPTAGSAASAERDLDRPERVPIGARGNERPASSEPSAEARVPASPTDPTWSPTLIGLELEAYARSELRAGWKKVRTDDLPAEIENEGFAQFGEALASLPGSIGERLAQRQIKREVARQPASVDPARLFELLLEGDMGPLTEFASDPTELASLFRRSVPNASVGAEKFVGRLKDAVQDGATLDFPAGVFRIEGFMRSSQKSPRDLTLRGNGMDATLFVLAESFSGPEALERFSIQDCTVFVDGHYVFDQRRGPLTVTLDRVRVVGFDMGAGSSCVFASNQGLGLLVRDSRIEGGYGRSPRDGTLLDVRNDALVARFERSRLALINLSLWRLTPRVTIVFDGCELVDVLDRPDLLAKAPPGVSFVQSTVRLRESTTDEIPRRDLNELFPDWQARMRR